MMLCHLTERLCSAVAFDGWHEAASTAGRHRDLVARCLGKIMMREMAGAFGTWAYLTELERKVNLGLDMRDLRLMSYGVKGFEHCRNVAGNMRKAMRMLTNRQLGAGWNHWRNLIAEKHENEGRAAELRDKTIKRILYRTALLALEAMRDNAVQMRGLRKILNRIMWRAGVLCFEAWLEYVAKMSSVKSMMQRALSGVVQYNFDKWREVWEEAIEIRESVSDRKRLLARNYELKQSCLLVFLRWYQLELGRVWSQWEETCAEIHNERMAAARAMGHFFASTLRVAFIAFQQNVIMETKMRQALQLFANGASAKAFLMWRDNVTDVVRTRTAISKAAMFWGGKQMDAAWAGWRAVVARRRRAREGNTRALVAYAMVLQRRSIRAWAGGAHARKEDKRMLAMAMGHADEFVLTNAIRRWAENAEESAKFRRIIELVSGKQSKGMSRQVLHAWSKVAKKQKRDRAAISGILFGKYRDAAFREWAEIAKFAKFMSGKTAQALAMFSSRTSGTVFSAWRQCADSKRKNNLKLKHAVQKLKNRNLAGAYTRWLDVVVTTQKQQAAVKKSLAKIMMREMYQAFSTWSDNASTIAHHRAVLTECLNRVVKRRLMAGWSRWHEQWETATRNRKLLAKAARRMAQRTIRAAYEAWVNTVDETKRLRDIAERAVARLQMRAVLGAFTRWTDFLEEVLEARGAASRALNFFINRAIMGSWTRWREAVEEANEMREKMRLAVNRFVLAELEKAFRNWHDKVEDAKEMQEKMRVAVNRFVLAELQKCFIRWREGVEEAKDSREKMAAAVNRFVMAELDKSFNRWRDAVEEAADLRDKLHRALARFAMAELYKGFSAFRDNCVTMKEERRLAGKALVFMTNRALGAALTRWIEWTEEIVEMREKMETATRSFLMRAQMAAFSTWSHVASVEAERRRLVIEHVAKRMNKSVGFIFEQWFKYAQFEGRMKGILEKALRTLVNRAVKGAFVRWVEKMEEGRRIRIAMAKFVYGAQAAAFSRWVEKWEEAVVMRKIAMAIGYAEEGLLQRCMEKWVIFAETVKEEREKYKAAVLKFFGSLTAKAFEVWGKHTATMIRVKEIMGNGQRRKAKEALRGWSEEVVVAKIQRSKSDFLSSKTAAGVGRRAFGIWIVTMRGVRHWRLKHTREHFRLWAYNAGALKEDKRREEKLAHVLRQMMFGSLARVWGGWRLIIARNKRFFRKQQALKRAIAQGDDAIRRKRKQLVALAWRAWRVDCGKMAQVKQMLGRALRRSQGTFFARWWSYVEYRRAKLEKFSKAVELHRSLTKHMAFIHWADAATRASAEMDAKLATALEFAFGNSVAFVLSKWRAIVAESRQKKYAMQRLVGLLTGFGLENLGKHSLLAWRQVVRDAHTGTQHLRKAESHHRARVLDQAFLSWKIQSMPLTPGEHLKLLGERGDDVWDRDYDDRGDPTQMHAQVLVRRIQSMYDGHDPDTDDEAEEDIKIIRGQTPDSGGGGGGGAFRGVAAKAVGGGARSAGGGGAAGARGGGGVGGAASTGGRFGGRRTTTWVDDGEDGGSPSTPAVVPRKLGMGSAGGGSAAPRSALRSGGGGGGGVSSSAKRSSGGGGGGGLGFCAECGAPYTRPGQKFCMECGTPAQ